MGVQNTLLQDNPAQAEALTTQVEQPTSEQGAETQVSAQPEDRIPEKFRGKSAEDIAEAYSNLESHSGKLSSEKAHIERELEAIRRHNALLEQQMAFLSEQRRTQPQETQDPLGNIEEEFATDPQGAFRKVVAEMRRKPEEISERVTIESRGRAANDRYYQLKKENPDFVELESEMQTLARQLAPMVRKEYVNSPEMIDALYTLAKGRNVGKYAKAAAETSIKASNLVREEKRRAVSESSSAGAGGTKKAFEDMSLEEMKASLGTVER